MADGYRPEVAGGTTSGIFRESVVVNLCVKFGDPRTSSSFLAKNIFFQNGTRRLCFENPQFAYYVIGLVADRLVEERLQSRQT